MYSRYYGKLQVDPNSYPSYVHSVSENGSSCGGGDVNCGVLGYQAF